MDDLVNVWGDPQEYKGIKIYPVKLRDSYIFGNLIGCILIKKNRTNDPDIIRMSYLDFFISLCLEYEVALERKKIELSIDQNKRFNIDIQQKIESFYERVKINNLIGSFNDNSYNDENLYIKMFQELLQMVLKTNITIEQKNNIFSLNINDKKIYGNQFDNIRNIIFKQNCIDYDENMSEEFEQNLMKAQELYAKRFGLGSTLAERIVAYHCLTGIPYEQIKNYTIFQFNKGLERFQLIKDYEVWSYPAWKAGETKKISHWLKHIPEAKSYEHLLVDVEEVKQKVKL